MYVGFRKSFEGRPKVSPAKGQTFVLGARFLWIPAQTNREQPECRLPGKLGVGLRPSFQRLGAERSTAGRDVVRWNVPMRTVQYGLQLEKVALESHRGKEP